MEQQDLTTENLFAALPEPLLAWYAAAARDLPWRRTEDPYRILVSEIMLQQTRVAAVLGYYERFLAALPTVEALAAAPEEQLLKLWEGLGYYSRARNLHRAAKIIAAQGFPTDYAGLRALPGVGDYTAGAVASAAFGQREAAVDGNVLRLAARLTDCHDDVTDARVRRRVRAALQETMPTEGQAIRLYNQALMELGATLCGPDAAPRCADCPLARLCRGRARGTAAGLPVRRAKKERRVEEKTVLLLVRGAAVALRRRPRSGLLAGLWEFPNLDGALDERGAAAAVKELGLTPRAWGERLSARHLFTHVEWHMTGYVIEVSGAGPADLLWADAEALRRLAVPSAFARYTAAARERLEKN